MSWGIRGTLCAIVVSVVTLGHLQPAVAAEAKSEFVSDTVDLGIVVSDVDKAVKFYTQALGFKEVRGFSVTAEFCADAGLTDKQPLTIHVLVLGDDAKATRLKLMEVPGVTSKTSDNAFVPSQLGFRYLTIHVTNATAAAERLKKAGVKPLAKGPVPLPTGLPSGNALTVVRDPDGNLVELVGPKR
jgi:catechol 2,3-dioxygenase-like lactoylglutathione lyase family enzyme